MRPIRATAAVSLFSVAIFPVAFSQCDAAETLRVSPARVILDNPEASQQLLVTARNRTPRDRTRSVRYRSANPKVAVVTRTGRVFPRGEGTTRILILGKNSRIAIPVNVSGLSAPKPVSFRHEIIPIATPAGVTGRPKAKTVSN